MDMVGDLIPKYAECITELRPMIRCASKLQRGRRCFWKLFLLIV